MSTRPERLRGKTDFEAASIRSAQWQWISQNCAGRVSFHSSSSNLFVRVPALPEKRSTKSHEISNESSQDLFTFTETANPCIRSHSTQRCGHVERTGSLPPSPNP